LRTLFDAAGLDVESVDTAFLSKIVVATRR